MERDAELLRDMLGAVRDVMEFSAGVGFEEFRENKALRYAMLHSLTILGEAAGKVSEELRVREVEVPWRKIVGFRNRVVHGYGELDLELVWEIVRVLVPELRGQLERLVVVDSD